MNEVLPLLEFVIFSTTPEIFGFEGGKKTVKKFLRVLIQTQDNFFGENTSLPTISLPTNLDADTAASQYIESLFRKPIPPIFFKFETDPKLRTSDNTRVFKFIYYVLVSEELAKPMSNGDYKWLECDSIRPGKLSDPDLFTPEPESFAIENKKTITDVREIIMNMRGEEFILSILNLTPETFTSRDAEMTVAAIDHKKQRSSFIFYRYLTDVTNDTDWQMQTKRAHRHNPDIVKLEKETENEHKDKDRRGKRAVKYKKLKYLIKHDRKDR